MTPRSDMVMGWLPYGSGDEVHFSDRFATSQTEPQIDLRNDGTPLLPLCVCQYFALVTLRHYCGCIHVVWDASVTQMPTEFSQSFADEWASEAEGSFHARASSARSQSELPVLFLLISSHLLVSLWR